MKNKWNDTMAKNIHFRTIIGRFGGGALKWLWKILKPACEYIYSRKTDRQTLHFSCETVPPWSETSSCAFFGKCLELPKSANKPKCRKYSTEIWKDVLCRVENDERQISYNFNTFQSLKKAKLTFDCQTEG